MEEDRMKRNRNDIRDVVYVHLDKESGRVLSYGIDFYEFVQSIPSQLENLLLLKHRFDDGDFNLHTRLAYVPAKRIPKLLQDDLYSYGNFCWIDFLEVESLNQLTNDEIAELLYIGHMKQPLRQSYFNKLANNYIYLANGDGWFNKTYYREVDDFFTMLGGVVTEKMKALKIEKTILGLGKKRSYPVIKKDTFYFLEEQISKGMVISLEKAAQSRSKIEVPIWTVGDYIHMDHMNEAYEMKAKGTPNAKLVFDRKARTWSIYRK